MVSPTSTWPAVSVNGSRASNSSAMPPATCGRGMAGMAAAASRRCASAACSMNASSHLSLFLRPVQVRHIQRPVDGPDGLGPAG